MRIFKKSDTLCNFLSEIKSNTAITIGNFDGVHLGHQKIIEDLLKEARKNNLLATIVTFFPHPKTVIAPHKKVPLLTPLNDKLKIFEKLGIDITLIIPFDNKFRQIEAKTFFKEFIINKFRCKVLILGPDSRFGKNREGNFENLLLWSKEDEIKIKQINRLVVDGIPISSSIIRQFIKEGKVFEVSKLLGRYYRIKGEVIKGEGRGRRLGIPTINIDTTNKLLPANGVYSGRTWIDGIPYVSVISVGTKPTYGKHKVTLEAHILNFNQNLYGKIVSIEFKKRLRDEIKFKTEKALIKQIHEDIKQTLSDFSTI